MGKKIIKKYMVGVIMIVFMLLVLCIARNMEQSLARYILTRDIDIPIFSTEYYLEVESGARLFDTESLNTSVILKNNDGTNYTTEDIEYTITAISDNFDVIINDSANGILTGGSINSNLIPIVINKKTLSTLSAIELVKIKINITYPYEEEKIIVFVHTKYVINGIKLHYDGIVNTFDNHSNITKTWKDIVADNDGKVLGNPTWDNDNLEFNGIDSKVKLIGDVDNNYTMSFVILPVLTGTYPRILGEEAMGGNTGNPTFPAIYLRPEANYYKISFYGQEKDAIFGGNPIPSEINKTVITVTYDGTNVKLYMNGVYVSQITTPTPPTPQNSVYLGGNGSEARYYTGKIYNFIWYDRALTPSEIEYNFELDELRFNI